MLSATGASAHQSANHRGRGPPFAPPPPQDPSSGLLLKGGWGAYGGMCTPPPPPSGAELLEEPKTPKKMWPKLMGAEGARKKLIGQRPEKNLAQSLGGGGGVGWCGTPPPQPPPLCRPKFQPPQSEGAGRGLVPLGDQETGEQTFCCPPPPPPTEMGRDQKETRPPPPPAPSMPSHPHCRPAHGERGPYPRGKGADAE